MNDYGYHWTPCRRGGGGGGGGRAVLVVLAVVVIAAFARSAIAVALDLLEIATIAAGVLGTVGGGVAVLVWRLRRQRAAAIATGRPVLLRAVAKPGAVGQDRAPEAINPPRADASAYLRINAIPHVVTSDDAARDHCPYLNCHHNHPELSPSRQLRRKEDKRDG